ncbi:MAG: TIGR02757 family protein [Sphingobacteriales bacterium JAD_PAG50586_3]|nr:MAG: TIGR02757 family protein [Sphingobacteriales bacterium JAD_PAG50586_3]
MYDLQGFLDEKYKLYNSNWFIDSDPVSIPHLFTKKEDIEIAGFLAATIAWGNRKSILNNANKLMQLMDNVPHHFVLNATAKDLKPFSTFVHRTFNGVDCVYFLKAIKEIYTEHGGMENAFLAGVKKDDTDVGNAIAHFRELFFLGTHPERSRKHVSNPLGGSSAKRLCMYLRWMVRKDEFGVDFGIWQKISPAILSCPLDVHSGTVARKLGLLQRTQNDWRAVTELTTNLKQFDPADPVKYDFALFGLGVFEKF